MCRQIRSGILICCLHLLVVLNSLKGSGAGVISQDCDTVKVSGAQGATSINGIYFLDKDIHCNERQVWLQSSGEHYLYYLLDGFNGWVISPSSCFTWGDFIAAVKSSSEKPYEVKETWKEYASALEEIENPYLAVECSTGDEATSPDKLNCESRPCTNGGTCLDAQDGYSCICQHGFFGHRCQTLIDTSHCKSSPCENGAKCIDLLNDFDCKCQRGFEGRTCSVPVSDKDANEGGKDIIPLKHFWSIRTNWKVALVVFGLIAMSVILILATVAAICARQKQAGRRSIKDNFSKGSFQYKQLEDLPNSTASSEADDHKVWFVINKDY